MEWWSATVVWAGLAAVMAYLYSRYRQTYWRRRGVSGPCPTPIVGNFGQMLLGRESAGPPMLRYAEQFREQGYCGVYLFNSPVLLVWDAEMAKQVLCQESTRFRDRGIPFDERDPLGNHLFNLGGSKWRNLRNRLTPTFTSGKIKLMFGLMREIGDELSAAVRRRADQDEVEVGDLMSRFATDVISSCAFGVQCHCLREDGDDTNAFLSMSRRVLQPSAMQLVRMVLDMLHPALGRLLPYRLLLTDVARFFLDLMRDTVAHRERLGVVRPDFVHLMMQLRADDPARADPDHHILLTPNVMAAQAFIFFIAGLDSIANTVSFVASRLADDTDLQERAAAEVRDVLRGGELTYDAVKRMGLVQRCVLEGLRLWTPVAVVIRKCDVATQIGDVLVEKDVLVMVVTSALHRDPHTFPQPDVFDPDRHSAEARAARHPCAFLPFGDGPRACIAERFALLEMAMCLATLLRDFAFAPGPGFERHVQIDEKATFPKAKNGFWLRVRVRE